MIALMNAYFNIVNANLALGVKNPVLSSFSYIKFLDLTDLKIFTDLELFALIAQYHQSHCNYHQCSW